MMSPKDVRRLRALLATCPPIDHAGRTVGRTLYKGWGKNDVIGMMDTRDLGEMIVLAYRYAREQLLKMEP